MKFPVRVSHTNGALQDTCYHCPFAHPGLCEALDMDEYHSVCYEHNSFQFSPLAPPEERPQEGGEWDTITANRIEGVTHPTCTPVPHCDHWLLTADSREFCDGNCIGSARDHKH